MSQKSGVRRLAIEAALVAALVALVGCGQPTTRGTQPHVKSAPPSRVAEKAGPDLPGVRLRGQPHKVKVPTAEVAKLRAHGARLIGTYGSSAVVQVDDAGLARLDPKTAQLRDDFDQVLLNAGTVDTQSKYWKSYRGVALPSGSALHLVQFAGPIQPAWLKKLKATGVRIVSYVPNNAYLVYGDAAAFNQLQRFVVNRKLVQWDGDFAPDFKIAPSVNKLKTDAYAIQLVKDPAANADTLAQIRSLQTKDAVVQEALGYVDVVAYVNKAALSQLAQRPDVVSIHPAPTPTKLDERQDMIISGNVVGSGPSGPGYLAWLASKGFTQAAFNASGFGVDLTDSGIDNGTQSPNHFGFYAAGDINGTSRVIYNRLEGTPNSGSTIEGCDGHGTLNSHIIAGFSDKTVAPFADSEGFAYGLGVAPFVKVGSSVIFDPGNFTFPVYEDLQSEAFADGMRISSNSWGANTADYTSDSQRYDALVRDAQPTGSTDEAPGNQEMVIVFAAGNSGPDLGSVGSPGTAKNVLTSGASEGVQAFGGNDACDLGDSDADLLGDVAFFSGRGPTSDGRVKPELMAPGTHISGGVAQAPGQHSDPPGNPMGEANSCFDASGVCAGVGSNFFPAGQEWYTASDGTSHSTPAISGASALVRQYFINQGWTPPSPAMNKAYLMSSARYMDGAGANDDLYSNNQGMGLMDLGTAFDGVSRLLSDEDPARLLTASGQTQEFTGKIDDTGKPFRVTLAWTDAPGSTAAAAWNNDLDLTVTVGGKTYKGNVFSGASSIEGGVADSMNNVESVVLPAGVSGYFKVSVTGSNINSDGVPGNADVLDQDFALVGYNACTTPGDVVSGVSAVASAANVVDVSWTPNGAAEYHIFRGTTAGGPYTQVGTSTTGSFQDTTVSGGSNYFYVVRAVVCAESADSNEATVTATGNCILPPVFAGLGSATNGQLSTCTNTLSWSAATASCGGTISYSVYRGNSSGFTPSNANRISSGLTGTTFNDDLNLAQGSSYYYVVRAVETKDVTVEDPNTVEKSAAPSGAITADVDYTDDFDGNRPANADAYWSADSASLNLVSGCHYQSPTNAYRWGDTSTSCGGSYPNFEFATLSLGGDGSVDPAINGFVLPASVSSAQLSFNLWYDNESTYDGAWLSYSTSGPTGPWTQVPDSFSSGSPYIVDYPYDDYIDNGNLAWTGTNDGANGALQAVNVDVSQLSGTTVWFAFQFASDSSFSYEGTYLDNVHFEVNKSIASCTTNVPPPGPAVAFQLALPVSPQAGVATSFDITAVDAVGQVASGYSGSAAITSSDAQATLPAPVTFSSGAANDVSITFGTAGSQTVTATDTVDPTTAGSGSVDVTPGAPTQLRFTRQPSEATAGNAISPSVQVSAFDSYGNLATDTVTSITLDFANNAGGGVLSGNTTVDTVNGAASFAGLSIDKAAAGYTLAASSSGLTGDTSAAFDIVAGPPASISIGTQPSNVIAGNAITPPVTVALFDAYGNASSGSGQVTASLATNPSAGTLGGNLQVAAVNGVATFPNLWIDKAGAGYQLQFVYGSLSATVSSTFDVAPAAAYRVAFTQQPTDVTTGSAITPAVAVTLYDRYDNVATTSTNPIVIALGNNPGKATLVGGSAVTPVAGVASFASLALDRTGQDFTLVAGSSGLYSDTSVGFDVAQGSGPVLGDAAQLAISAAPTAGVAGTALANVTVKLEDAAGNVLTNDSHTVVSLSLGANAAGGELFGPTAVTASAGVATFSNVEIRKAGQGYTLIASATGYGTASTAAFNVAAGAAASFTVTVPPSVTALQAVPVSATAQDAYGNLATGYSGAVTLTSSDPGAVLPTGASFSAGVLGPVDVTFSTLGLATVSVTDSSNAALTRDAQLNVTPVAQPTVTITSPTTGSTVSGQVKINVMGAVASGASLQRIDVLLDGQVLNSGTTSPFVVTWDTSRVADQSNHTISAVITDSQGNVVSSAPIGVTVSHPEGLNPSSGGGCSAASDPASGVMTLLFLGLFLVFLRRRPAVGN